MSKFKSAHIKSDTDWKLTATANPMRGYHDHERTVEFLIDTPAKVMEDVVEAMLAPYKGKGGPTWAYHRKVSDYKWYLRQGYDSGD